MELPDVPARIVCAPMAGGPSTPELAAAVGAAGGLGTLAAGYLSADRFAADITRTRALTGRPFAVNLFVGGPAATRTQAVADYAERLRPLAVELGVAPGEPFPGGDADDDDFAAKLDVLVRARPALVSFAFGLPPSEAVDRCHDAGIPVAITVTDERQALAAAGRGADALIAQGWEAGGHRGGIDPDDTEGATGRLALLPLLARVRASVDLPVLAAGGIADGAGVAAALAAGASAAVVGTAFLRTPEAGTSPVHRAALTSGRQTVVSRAFTGRLARGLDNAFTREHGSHAPAAYPQVHRITAPLRAEGRRRGDPELVNLWAGQAAALSRDAPAGNLVAEWHAQAQEALAAARSTLAPPV
ncbi:nitronate monooxygenase [Frankia sp. AgB1.9]|uniref:nitronate monooxygenase n=1 Tax=unclassified Frankia TaxID=2632575 RepID=UPI001933E729|nr:MULTISPECIES: nitronate monooxygenase [unclassified Frankia]MBL7489655.1 nitronate monooxygenase [Frankia sp. AgW1.1]MBL7548621.1 nitronate monooxygenase [Frankia sp. AgB1.9]